MDVLHIDGGRPLRGRVRIGGAKNAALPMLAATLACDGPVTLHRVPDLTDTRRMIALLRDAGATVVRTDDAVTVDPPRTAPGDPDAALVGSMRAGVCLLGPLLARWGRVRLPQPGGCPLGVRPIDLHVRGLTALGAVADEEDADGGVTLTCDRLRGAEVDMAGPRGGTVTGTINVLVAAARATGRTVLTGAAREPEVVAVGRMLIAAGATIDGLGTDTLRIDGVARLGGCTAEVPADRVEAATWAVAVAATGGRAVLDGIDAAPLAAVVDLLRNVGATVEEHGTPRSPRLVICANRRPRPFAVRAAAFPGMPTDVLPLLGALAAVATGPCTLSDGVFPDRDAHLSRLARFGAGVRTDDAGSHAIDGRPDLSPACVDAPDLRAAAALVVAMLAARGRSSLTGAEVLDRGYERFTAKLRALGATARRLGEPLPVRHTPSVLRLTADRFTRPSPAPSGTGRPLQPVGAGRKMAAASPAVLAAVG